MTEPMQKRESSLKFMTHAVACMIDGTGFTTSSVEGRIAVDYLDPSPKGQTAKYAFKCHRQTVDGIDHVWPVNAIAFHPVHNTFASGGSDGAKLAVGVSYGRDEGNKPSAEVGKTAVMVREVGDEAKPKAK